MGWHFEPAYVCGETSTLVRQGSATVGFSGSKKGTRVRGAPNIFGAIRHISGMAGPNRHKKAA